jgi:hypothetical protein
MYFFECLREEHTANFYTGRQWRRWVNVQDADARFKQWLQKRAEATADLLHMGLFADDASVGCGGLKINISRPAGCWARPEMLTTTDTAHGSVEDTIKA